jgi:SP family general alpha glucoside:H+ symporter-like MFS transporter
MAEKETSAGTATQNDNIEAVREIDSGGWVRTASARQATEA